jgi:hypothetical protein
MRYSVDHELVRRLLEDDSLSYREIARQAGCSDFTVRAIARKNEPPYPANDSAPPSEPLTAFDWCVVAGIAILIFGAMWFAASRMPPDGGPMA